MTARSGIAPSGELSQCFAGAHSDPTIRFIKASISNESIVLDSVANATGDFLQDLLQLQDLLLDEQPAYILAKLDVSNSGPQWLAVSYVPDNAKVREKMLYASTRSAITQSLGSNYFSDSLFVSSKSELTPDAYKSHLAHLAAPKPLSAREKELEDIKISERLAENSSSAGTQARKTHIPTTVGLTWEDSLTDAVLNLGNATTSQLVLAKIDAPTEVLTLSESREMDISQIGSALPSNEPVYAWVVWCRDSGSKALVFVYSCPSGASIKSRMLYAASVATTVHVSKQHLSNHFEQIKRIETSEPHTLDTSTIAQTLDHDHNAGGEVEQGRCRVSVT